MDAADRLMLDICRCPNIELAKNDTSHPCHQVVAVQRNSEEFQLPEPWTGDLSGSRLLVIASNPSIDEKEAYPTVDWADKWILDFFNHRFDEDYGWTLSGLHVLLKDNESYAKRVVRYWAEVQNQSSRIFGFDATAGIDYTMTEIVHCKSRGREGVASAAMTCSNRWMNRILTTSSARVLLVLGNEAGEMLEQFTGLQQDQILHKGSILAGSERWVLFLPAPGSSKTRNVEIVLNQNELSELRAWINL